MIEEPPGLEALQGWMQDALVFPRRNDPDVTESIVEASPRLTGKQRLAIYQRNYVLRLLKCMDEQFPALRHALGAELFSDFVREYLRVLPSDSYTLYELGRRFPGYLEQTRPDREKAERERESWPDFMVDLAQCERDVFVMFDAPGHEGKPLADEKVPDVQLRLQPCFALHSYRFPVSWYYHQVQDGNDPAIPEREPTYVALVRKDYLTRTIVLGATHHAFVKAVESGAGIAGAIDAYAKESGCTAEEAANAWSGAGGFREHWIDAGFFIDAEQQAAATT